tara:strand:+ start:28477 stop:28683 length:207 start_codon:yes stop_codon:yes gene_type:complete
MIIRFRSSQGFRLAQPLEARAKAVLVRTQTIQRQQREQQLRTMNMEQWMDSEFAKTKKRCIRGESAFE